MEISRSSCRVARHGDMCIVSENIEVEWEVWQAQCQPGEDGDVCWHSRGNAARAGWESNVSALALSILLFLWFSEHHPRKCHHVPPSCRLTFPFCSCKICRKTKGERLRWCLHATHRHILLQSTGVSLSSSGFLGVTLLLWYLLGPHTYWSRITNGFSILSHYWNGVLTLELYCLLPFVRFHLFLSFSN